MRRFVTKKCPHNDRRGVQVLTGASVQMFPARCPSGTGVNNMQNWLKNYRLFLWTTF